MVQAYFLTLIVFCFTTEVKVLQDGNRYILNNVLQCICIKILSLSVIIKHWFLKYIRSKNSTYTCIGKLNCITMWWKIMCLFSHKNFKYSSVHIDLCIVYLCEFVCTFILMDSLAGSLMLSCQTVITFQSAWFSSRAYYLIWILRNDYADW